ASVPEWVALYLVLIAVVTLPHVVVVSIMDREQGVWA
ncbi:MAG: Brp/Blh family beta-carotene 15,15'-dioxygenase, partial [Haloarcula sp.]